MNLEEFLRKYGLETSYPLKGEREFSKDALERFISAQVPIESFQDLEASLPKGLRYVGPGAWLQAIEETFTPPGESERLSTAQTRKRQ